VKIEGGARIQKLIHESINRLKNCSESDESDARVHESYSQIFDSFGSRFIRKVRKIRVQITPLFHTVNFLMLDLKFPDLNAGQFLPDPCVRSSPGFRRLGDGVACQDTFALRAILPDEKVTEH
jgi:hypothetical protein